jgi:hypothetical protein
MRPTTESALLAMVIGGGQRLLFRFSERGNEAFFHGSVRVRNPGMDIARKLYIGHLTVLTIMRVLHVILIYSSMRLTIYLRS